MMLDADKMVAAASSRNPTLAGALTRLQRCAFNGSWEVYVTHLRVFSVLYLLGCLLPPSRNLNDFLNGISLHYENNDILH